MRSFGKPLWIKYSFAIVALFLLAGGLYQIPAIRHKLDWRLEGWLIYIHSVFQPIQEVPTAVATQSITTPTPEPAKSPTPLTLLPSPTPPLLPQKVTLAAPGFEGEDWNNCGPATLAMGLRYYGWEGNQYTISSVLKPIREDRNVNIDELTEYVNQTQKDLKAVYRWNGSLALIRSLLAAGYPVIVETGIQLKQGFWVNDDRWAGHYLLLTGYDDTLEQFISQDSYLAANRPIAYGEFDQQWQAFGHVYLIAYSSDQESALRLLLGKNWDEVSNRQIALEAAYTETGQKSNNAFAWFNLGSILALQSHYAESARAFDRARQIGLPQRLLRYRFEAFGAYASCGRWDDLLTLTNYALTITANSEEALYWRGVASIAQGKTSQAQNYWRQALEAHPGYPLALNALQTGQTNIGKGN